MIKLHSQKLQLKISLLIDNFDDHQILKVNQKLSY